MEFYYFLDGSTDGVLFSAEHGVVRQCQWPHEHCFHLKAPRTSAAAAATTLVAYEIVAPPKGYCTGLRNTLLGDSCFPRPQCKAYGSLAAAAAACDAIANCTGVAKYPRGDYQLRGGQGTREGQTRVMSWSKGCDKCAGKRNVDVPMCRDLSINVQTGKFQLEVGWEIFGACPDIGQEVGSLSNSHLHTSTVCLSPGVYQFLAVDKRDDGWDGGYFGVSLKGVHAPLIPDNEVKGVRLLHRPDRAAKRGVS